MVKTEIEYMWFLEFIRNPREIYVVLEKFGYKNGPALMDYVVANGFAERKEHMIRLNRRGFAMLEELRNPRPPAVEEPKIEEIPEPVKKGFFSRFTSLFGLRED